MGANSCAASSKKGREMCAISSGTHRRVRFITGRREELGGWLAAGWLHFPLPLWPAEHSEVTAKGLPRRLPTGSVW